MLFALAASPSGAAPLPSFRRKPESRIFNIFWTGVCRGDDLDWLDAFYFNAGLCARWRAPLPGLLMAGTETVAFDRRVIKKYNNSYRFAINQGTSGRGSIPVAGILDLLYSAP